jgi:hypothetical protein
MAACETWTQGPEQTKCTNNHVKGPMRDKAIATVTRTCAPEMHNSGASPRCTKRAESLSASYKEQILLTKSRTEGLIG